MKRYKRILPSTLALITLTTSVTTTTVFAETKNEYSVGETVTDEMLTEASITETTTGSGIQLVSNKSITPKIENGEIVTVDGWSYKCNTTTNTAIITSTDHKSGNVTIPDKVTVEGVDYKVTILDVGLFQNADELEIVVIPEGVYYIEEYCFTGCTALREVEMSSTIRIIGGEAFSGCSSLAEIEIPEGDAIIGSLAFKDCTSLTKIKIPEGIRELKERTFEGCESLTEVELPESLEYLYRYSFYGCTSLTEIKLPSNLKLISDNAFENTALMYIDIPENMGNLYLNFIGGEVYTLEAENTNPDSEDKTTSAYIDTPITGEVVDITSLPPSADKYIGHTLYMKYNITPLIDLDGGEMVGNKTFPAWTTAENFAEYLDVPTNGDKEFKGWEIVKAETLNKNGVEYLVGLVELKATWENLNGENTKDVTFDANGGTPATTIIEQTEGEKYILPAVEPTKEGYEFKGWFDADGNKITADKIVENLADKTVFYAEWEESTLVELLRNVIFDTNDGTSTQIEIAQIVGENFKLPDLELNRDGYEFLGWFNADGVQITADTIVEELEDGAIFYAEWVEKNVEENIKNAIFDTNYGTSTQTTIAQTIGEKFVLPEVAPTRSGYTFLGWFNAKGVQITSETVVDELEDGTVFYAKWKKDSTNNNDDDTDTDTNGDTDTNNGTNTDNNTNTDNGGNSTNTTGDNVDNNVNGDSNINGEQSQNGDPRKLLFNTFRVKAGSNEFITTYIDGSVKHTYAYNKSYIDPKTKSMYVSLRGVLDNSLDDVKLSWNAKTRTAEVDFVDKDVKIMFTANSSIMIVNGVERQMLSVEGVPIDAQLDNGRIMIPLRYISELFDLNVSYDNTQKLSVVSTNRDEM